MNSEKVKEIKKVLEQNTKTCLLYDFEKNSDCKTFQCKYILDYINELESENERLSKENFVLCRDRFTKKELDDISACRVTKATKELKDRIAELETKNEVLCVELSRYTENCVEMKNGTLKQFAGRLKEKLEEYRLENEYFIKDEPNGNLWQLNASVFCIEVTQDGGLVDETLKEFINE